MILTDKGKKGVRRQQTRSWRALIEAVGALLARGTAQTHLSALLAVQEADHLPQHAAVVSSAMDDHRGEDGDTLRANGPQGDRRDTAFVPRFRPEPARIDDFESPARLGAVAPARLGRADLAVFVHKRPAKSCNDDARSMTASSRPSRRRAPTPGSPKAPERFLGGNDYSSPIGIRSDILDVWFDSGSTHAFVLEQRKRTTSNGRRLSIWKAPTSIAAGSTRLLLEACGTRGRAPYDTVRHARFPWLTRRAARCPSREGNAMVPQVINRSERRRHPASLGHELGLCRRHPHRP